MFAKLFAMLCLLVCSLFSSIAMAVEEPRYEILSSEGSFEIRRYAPMLVAETFVDGDMDTASNRGFRLIADYIFGNNQLPGSDQRSTIAMTAPVAVEPQSVKIAMTAPVTIEAQTAGSSFESALRWRVHFVMPATYTLETIPKHRNAAIALREIPAKYFVVHQYTWLNTTSRVQEKTLATLQWAQQKLLHVVGPPQLARYDPPWTLPMFKRNEIMVEISKP